MKQPYRPQHGVATIAAIFLMVVLAALGAFMVTFSNTQQLTAAQDFLGTRAYWAARSGVQWAIGNLATACPAQPVALVATQTKTSAPLVLDTFSVTVTCTLSGFAERTATPTIPNVFIYQITAVAIGNGAAGGTAYIERSFTASIERQL